MVAKSYQGLIQVGEPYKVDGKMYVNLQMKSGKVKPARWYTDSEYKRLYGEVPAVPRSTDPYYKPQSVVLGFEKGYITIFKGDRGLDEEDAYFKYNPAFRYCLWWGWYVPSCDVVPKNLPEDVEPIQLPWNLIGDSNGKIYAADKVETAVNNLRYPASEVVFPFSIGERVELDVTVTKNITLENNFGNSVLHKFTDTFGNIYIWITTAKSWQEGTTHHIRGTVKENKRYKGESQTILTRCLEK